MNIQHILEHLRPRVFFGELLPRQVVKDWVDKPTVVRVQRLVELDQIIERGEHPSRELVWDVVTIWAAHNWRVHRMHPDEIMDEITMTLCHLEQRLKWNDTRVFW